MKNCVNCSNEAVYEYSVSKSLKLYYCVPHMPKFLRGKSDAGLKVKLIEKTIEVAVEPEPEPVEEVVEEPKPAPKKRAPKKKKVEESTDGAD